MSDTIETSTFRFPASVELRASDDQLIEKLKKRVGAARVENGDPFFWRALISNTELDSHFTEMRPSSLKNYARDAKSGVAFQDSHKIDSITRTLGRSLTGEYTPLDEDKYANVLADFYTFRGRDTIIDSFINRVEDGLANDVSIGFVPGRYICSICKRDMMAWDMDDWKNNCWHYPGFEYTDEKTGERQLCTAGVEDARLVEVSTVYAGSTPGASIIRAERMLEAGKLPEAMARRIEDRYQVRLLNKQRVYLPSSIQESAMGTDTQTPAPLGDATETPDPIETKVEERTVETAPVVTPEAQQMFDGIRELLMSKNLIKGTLVESVRALVDENARLAPLADDGKKYRADLMDSAIEEGIRAYAPNFAEEVYRGMLNTLPIDAIRQMRDDWKTVADKLIPKGRQTGNDGNPPPARSEEDSRRHKA